MYYYYAEIETVEELVLPFEVRDTSIYDTATEKLICSVWPERKAAEEQMDGESWLAMRKRTQAERDEIKRHTEKRAAAVCAFLNAESHP